MFGLSKRRPNFAHRGFLFLLALGLLSLSGCAEVTQPTPTVPQIEAAQLAAAKRHPYLSWSRQRCARVFLRLLPYVPQTQGRTYPFLGFNWWVTATGKVAVDQVWFPSPADEAELKQGNKVLKERGLKQGDIILAVNNWPIPTEAASWDEAIRTMRDVFKDVFFVFPHYSYQRNSGSRGVTRLASMFLPGELLPAIMTDLKNIDLEVRGRYFTGPVELLIQRDDQKYTTVLYPQILPAEYAILVNTKDRSINACAAPGQIILNQRLVNFCLNDDELALVIGHEMAHQVLGHITRGTLHRKLGQFIGETFTAFTTLSLNRLLNWRHAMVSPDVRRVSQSAVVSVFSQDNEREADIYGAWYAFQAGYNIEKGAAIWERMAAVVAHDPFEANYFLNDHPSSLERFVRLKLIAQYFEAGRAAEVFLQTADLNRRPPPQVSDPINSEVPVPPPPPSRPPQMEGSEAVGSIHRNRDGHPGLTGEAVYSELGFIGGQKPTDHE
ncbi:MAG: M48 family metalloprotease [Deltaproteobacteria bacterium]|jgi:Zn-dependent protease with chaperone function